MQLKFEGNTHSIDANTLISVIAHYQTIAQTANAIYGGGAREIRVNVNAIERGSFVIDLTVVQNVVERLFSKDATGYIAELITIIGGVYALYKHFKGKPAKTEEEKTSAQEQISVNVENVIKVYNQPIIREAISKSVARVSEDTSIESFSIVDDERTTSFMKEDYKEYIYDDFDQEEGMPDERTIEKEAILTIIALNFEHGSRWQFMYDGFKIAMFVKDDALMKKIDEGERFGKGDAIRVKMRIVQSYNKEYNAYENKSYKIVEFIEHIVPKKPLELFGGSGKI